MRNIKDQIYKALCDEFGEERVTDQYPKTWTNLPAVQYTEEDNKVYESTNKEEKAYVRYRIDIWDAASTSVHALTVDQAIGLSGFGLCRTGCTDAPDPAGFKHKQMRYEAVIDDETDDIFWLDTQR